jgi:hypothetical protein
MIKTKDLFQEERQKSNYFTYGEYKFWEEKVNPITGWVDTKEYKRSR